MLISTGVLNGESLAGQVAIVTGGGDGIGYEATRALLWLGASVTIAELDDVAGTSAVARLRAEMADPPVLYVHTDVADEMSVANAVEQTMARFGAVDIVVNNATFAPAGLPVTETAVVDWDRSYAVNLRGPVLLARACLPSMVARRHGVFVCVSSTGGPFLGPYETLKAAQLTLAETLDAELDGSGVTAFTIGPDSCRPPRRWRPSNWWHPGSASHWTSSTR
jgi:NAD(P)-dependent dehydrogenase (short-subunit alcohol dehydrogenase family)